MDELQRVQRFISTVVVFLILCLASASIINIHDKASEYHATSTWVPWLVAVGFGGALAVTVYAVMVSKWVTARAWCIVFSILFIVVSGSIQTLLYYEANGNLVISLSFGFGVPTGEVLLAIVDSLLRMDLSLQRIQLQQLHKNSHGNSHATVRDKNSHVVAIGENSHENDNSHFRGTGENFVSQFSMNGNGFAPVANGVLHENSHATGSSTVATAVMEEWNYDNSSGTSSGTAGDTVEQRVATVREMLQRGDTVDAIADALGVSKSTVYRYMRILRESGEEQ